MSRRQAMAKPSIASATEAFSLLLTAAVAGGTPTITQNRREIVTFNASFSRTRSPPHDGRNHRAVHHLDDACCCAFGGSYRHRPGNTGNGNDLRCSRDTLGRSVPGAKRRTLQSCRPGASVTTFRLAPSRAGRDFPVHRRSEEHSTTQRRERAADRGSHIERFSWH